MTSTRLQLLLNIASTETERHVLPTAILIRVVFALCNIICSFHKKLKTRMGPIFEISTSYFILSVKKLLEKLFSVNNLPILNYRNAALKTRLALEFVLKERASLYGNMNALNVKKLQGRLIAFL